MLYSLSNIEIGLNKSASTETHLNEVLHILAFTWINHFKRLQTSSLVGMCEYPLSLLETLNL
jgi:hypothetical protein